MRSRPGAQHQSAECSIASCVVLEDSLPHQKKNRVPHKRSERAGREKREEEIDQEREIEREIEITRARDAAKGRSILTYK